MKHILGIVLLMQTSIGATKLYLPAEPRFTIHRTDTQSQPEYVMLYAHGLGATQSQGIKHFAQIAERKVDGELVYNKYWLFQEPLALFNFPDANPLMSNAYQKPFVNLGQRLDQERLLLAHQKTREELPSCKGVIGAGISRGAAAWFTYTACHKPHDVVALILESPFDTIKSMINHLMARCRIGWLPFSTSLGMWFARKHFPALNPHGSFPIDVAHQLPDIPVLIVHSKNDKVIPISAARRLYAALLESDHQHIYLCELSRGEHGKLIQGVEAEYYQNVAHAFLQQYGLPCNTTFAERGKLFLPTCQPSLQEVRRRIKKKRSLDLQDEEEWLPNSALEEYVIDSQGIMLTKQSLETPTIEKSA